MTFVDKETYKNLTGIYKVENTETGEAYIGQTRERFVKRFYLHRWKLRDGSHDNKNLQQSWDKYGEGVFIFKVIEVLPRETLDEREKYWIVKYREKGACFNLQDGGISSRDMNRFVTKESHRIVGEKNRQRMLGLKLSDETRAKMSATRKGRHIDTKSQVLTENQARMAKEMLVNGRSTREIVNELHIPYKPLNGILSGNTWATVHVDGWDEFVSARARQKSTRRKSEEEIHKVKMMYDSGHTYEEISNEVGWCIPTIQKYIKL